MIVKDEEANLAECLASIRGLVDEMIVVDTGSSDRTVEIAIEAGALVHHVPWTDDFAVARNAALEHCHGDWLFWIDADERVQPVDRASVEALLALDEVLAGRVALRRRSDLTPCWEIRLFRPHPDIRFEGLVHGDISDAVDRVARDEGRLIVDLPIAIEHLGYEGDQTERNARNVPMLRTRLTEEPDNTFCLNHLARLLLELGETDESEALFERGVAIVRSRLWVTPQDWMLYDGLIRIRFGKGEPVEDLLDEGARRFGHEPAFLVTRAEIRFAVRDFAGAAQDMEQLVAIDPDTHVGRWIALPVGALGAPGWTVLGTCRFELGDFGGAADAFEEAYRREPTMERKAKATVARARAGGG